MGDTEYRNWHQAGRPNDDGGDSVYRARKGNSGNASECFVATACFEDANHSTVDKLRALRDNRLVKKPIGRAFIACYQEVGPRLAKIINAHPKSKPILRHCLTKLTKVLGL